MMESISVIFDDNEISFTEVRKKLTSYLFTIWSTNPVSKRFILIIHLVPKLLSSGRKGKTVILVRDGEIWLCPRLASSELKLLFRSTLPKFDAIMIYVLMSTTRD